MNMLERIETERLVLRRLRMDDAPGLFTAYMQDPEVTRYTTHPNISDIPRDSYIYAITK